MRRVGLVLYLIILFFVGLGVGALARLLLPGPDPMGIGMTALVGLCGTFSAGLFRGMCCTGTAGVLAGRWMDRCSIGAECASGRLSD